ncbi:universal stress protein [Leifsonia sp. NPDC102414]|uniref:universal stress protein n=1 Tax=Leifsonia sp. NPDC102414 TaxID=3364124 RepID=UPI0037FD1F20
MSLSSAAGPVVVGVYPGQPVAVVQEAAALAALLDRPMVCAYVTPDSYLTEWERADLRREASLHPEAVAPEDERLAVDLAAAITAALADASSGASSVSDAVAGGARALRGGWVLRMLAGDPAKALARLADEQDAAIVVVGTHQAGFGHAVEEWLSGSVAVQLTRAQLRSVLVVPIGHESRRTPTLG